jgi:AcrR family transcriptional regulator
LSKEGVVGLARGRDAGKKIAVDEPSKRQERAERILDVAAELMLRWGYRKTTIDDIARQAGVAKGTIYLHYKTREALFEAVVIREGLRVVREYAQHLENDPEGATLTALMQQAITATMNSPLLSATLRRDTEILGDMVHSASGYDIIQARIAFGRMYFELLRAHGMIRLDMELETQLKTLTAITTGFLLMNNLVPENFQFSQNEMMDALLETIHRTFDPQTPPDPDVVQEATQTFKQILMQLIDAIEKWYQEAQL